MRELEDLLAELDPPAGGLARLQRSVAATRRPVYLRPRWALVGAACVVVALAAVTVPPWASRQRRTDMLVQALRGNVEPVAGITVARGAAIELPSGQANAKLYLVQTATAGR